MWIYIVLSIGMFGAGFIGGYFLGRHDERAWNLFLYQYGVYTGRKEERRKHRD